MDLSLFGQMAMAVAKEHEIHKKKENIAIGASKKSLVNILKI
jgi:hypothetical protein